MGGGPAIAGLRRIAALVAAVVVAAGTAAAQSSMPLSVDRQLLTLLGILERFDRNVQHKVRNELKIGIVYAADQPSSLRTRDELVRTLDADFSRVTFNQLPIRHVTIAYASPRDLEAAVRANKVNVLYVTPGNEDNLDGILKISHTYGISSVTGVPDFVRRGVALGVGKKQSGPEIIVNLANSRSEGMNLHPSLLRIATVVETQAPETRGEAAADRERNRRNGKPK